LGDVRGDGDAAQHPSQPTHYQGTAVVATGIVEGESGNYSVLYAQQKKKKKKRKEKEEEEEEEEEEGGRRRKKEEEGGRRRRRRGRREEEEEEGRKKKGTLARKQVKKTGKGHGGFNSIPHFILE